MASSNWLALQKKLKVEKRKSTTTFQSARKKRKVEESHGRADSTSTSPSRRSFAKPSVDDASPSENMKGGESRGSLQQMVLGQLEYSDTQKQPGKYLALDCEMVGVGIDGAESSLARVSMVNFYGAVILDEFVKQKERVVDYRTQWSGIRETDMVNAKPFEEVQKAVAELLRDNVLIVHAGHNDLKALLLSHPRHMTRDTQYYAHKFGICKTNRVALRNLVKQELDLTIQAGEHSSVTDARATMAIYRVHKKQWEKGSRSLALSSKRSAEELIASDAIGSESTEKGKSKKPSTTVADSDVGSTSGKSTRVSHATRPGKAEKPSTTIPGGGRKGVSSGISTIVRRAGEKSVKVKGTTTNGNATSTKAKEKSEWWKQLPGGIGGARGAKGSITVDVKR